MVTAPNTLGAGSLWRLLWQEPWLCPGSAGATMTTQQETSAALHLPRISFTQREEQD